jgi:hypothetical protein
MKGQFMNRSIGIDYGAGKTNIDTENNIRYGVINVNEVVQDFYDSATPIDSNACPYCGNTPKSGNNIHEMKRCPSCYHALEENDFWDNEPIGWKINDGEYIAEISSDDTDIFILKSPYFTYCQYCSPCAPGAGYIMNTVKNGVKTYCFGHDFFDDEKAPYPVYSVETWELIEKGEEK